MILAECWTAVVLYLILIGPRKIPVVLENNNEYLTQLSAEGPPLFRSLLEALRE